MIGFTSVAKDFVLPLQSIELVLSVLFLHEKKTPTHTATTIADFIARLLKRRSVICILTCDLILLRRFTKFLGTSMDHQILSMNSIFWYGTFPGCIVFLESVDYANGMGLITI